MNWAFSQGLMGRQLDSLRPSSVAVGPNVYLRESDFLKMLALAVGVHAMIFITAGLFPPEKVTRIPVRSISFKLGDVDRIAAHGSPAAVPIVMNDTLPTPTDVPAPVMGSGESWTKSPVPETPPVTAKPRVAPVIKMPKVVPVNPPAPAPQAPSLQPDPPAIAATPQQYVREVGMPPAATSTPIGTPDGASNGQGNASTMSPQTAEAIREKYEMVISNWVKQHNYYPANAEGREGRTVVRMRIDRSGYVRYYAIEQSSGIAALDAAAIDMVRRANPVPAVPENYPAGTLIDFLIPITFRAPR